MTIRVPRRIRRPVLLPLVIGALLAAPVAVLASHQFTDVPADHPFHNDIAAVAAAGVTSGCAAGRYCPDAFVTRGQMAAFLNRLGALAAEKPPVVNADRLDGRHANELSRISSATSASGTVLTTTPTAMGPAVEITAPSDGYVLVVSSATVQNNGVGGVTCTATCNVQSRVRHVQTGAQSIESIVTLPSLATAYGNVTAMYVFPVDAGINTFTTMVNRHSGNGDLNMWTNNLSAIFSTSNGYGGS